jgi:hypothetical protein
VGLSHPAVQFRLSALEGSGVWKEIIDDVHVVRPIYRMIASQPLGLNISLSACVLQKVPISCIFMFQICLVHFCALFIGNKPRLLVHWHSDVLNKGILGKFSAL